MAHCCLCFQVDYANQASDVWREKTYLQHNTRPEEGSKTTSQAIQQ